jgi:sensor histidine kinase YesM
MLPRFFNKYEWFYHLAMMPVLMAVGNYHFVGESYFTNGRTFLIATAVIFWLYWISVILLTFIIRWVVRRYPEAAQTQRRVLVMLVLVGAVTVFLACFDVFIYSKTPGLNVVFNWDTVWPILVLGTVFDLFFCAVISLFYAWERWHQHQTENEKLERMAIQNQLDILKGQVNPHFLFNSLNTLSALISEDAQQAEDFVEDLAKIYRYMLQAAKTDVIYLKSELAFLKVYSRLLAIRYGEPLQITTPDGNLIDDISISPLALQALIDNAIKHNIMTPSRPLRVVISVVPNQGILVQNNIQRKTRIADGKSRGQLASLVEKYKLLSNRNVFFGETDNQFAVLLPLIGEK